MESVIVPPKRIAEILERSKEYLFQRTSFDSEEKLRFVLVERSVHICYALSDMVRSSLISYEEYDVVKDEVIKAMVNPNTGFQHAYLYEYLQFAAGDKELTHLVETLGVWKGLRTKYYVARRNEWLDDLITKLLSREAAITT